MNFMWFTYVKDQSLLWIPDNVLVLIVLLVYRANRANRPTCHGKISLNRNKVMWIKIDFVPSIDRIGNFNEIT